MSKPSVPVIMHHSIGIPNKNWQWNYLTCPYNVFENQLKWLEKKKFHTISLQQLYNYMNEGIDLPMNPIVLTFDDGFLDNWVFAYPLLKKYGFKGTIYVSPEFVDSRSIIRNNLKDLWNGDADINELDTTGYLSWNEIKKMENDGIIDIQSHTMTHTWYPISGKIIDFRHPDDVYTWMTWNNNCEKKPSLQIDNKDYVNYGEPVYQHGRAIGIKRYYPDENLKEHLINYVKEKGGANYFSSGNWRDELFKVVKKYVENNQINELKETEDEYVKRLYYELKTSKDLIENKLNKEIKFLCWPGGAITDEALKIALDVGYISSTAAKDITQRKHLKNKFGELPYRINRISPVLFWDGIEGFASKIKYKPGFYFVMSLYSFQADKPIIVIISRLVLILAHIFLKWYYQFNSYILKIKKFG